MGSLEDFRIRINDMISSNNFNLNISGVALIVNEAREHLYSASLIVRCPGQIPEVRESDILKCKSVLQRAQVCGFTLKYVHALTALFNDEKLLRWQVQYSVSL